MMRLGFYIILILTVVPTFGQETAPQQDSKKVNELLAGKLIYVAPMPDNIDEWIRDFLRRWGKYKVTNNPEGVDLVLKAIEPETGMEWENRGGVTQPKGSGSRLPMPLPKRGKKEKENVPIVSIDVIDWVANQRLWRAEILNRKQNKDEPAPPAGPETTVFARGMTPDAIAMKITRTLQAYVGELEKAAPSTGESAKQ